MQTLPVNGYDMAYLEIGRGRPLVCVHGTLGDFRTWSAVMGPLSKKHRVIAVSLRHFFPEHWDGVGNDYLMSQHVADMIGFLERLGDGPVDLIGHSRGGHISFRVAQQRPDLLRRLVLAEPGGELFDRRAERAVLGRRDPGHPGCGGDGGGRGSRRRRRRRRPSARERNVASSAKSRDASSTTARTPPTRCENRPVCHARRPAATPRRSRDRRCRSH